MNGEVSEDRHSATVSTEGQLREPAGPEVDGATCVSCDAAMRPPVMDSSVVPRRPSTLLSWFNPFSYLRRGGWLLLLPLRLYFQFLYYLLRISLLPFTWWLSLHRPAPPSPPPPKVKAADQGPAQEQEQEQPTETVSRQQLQQLTGQVKALSESCRCHQEEASRLARQLQDARKAQADLQDRLNDHEFQLEQMTRRNQGLQAMCDEYEQRSRQHAAEVELLEERLSHAHQQVEKVEQQLEASKAAMQPSAHALVPAAAPAGPSASPVVSFEVGFGAVEQSQLLNDLALHAESLAAAVLASWAEHTGVPAFMSRHARQSMKAYWDITSGALSTFWDRQATQAVLQEALMQAALDLAHSSERPAVITQFHAPVTAYLQEFVTTREQQRDIASAAQHLRCQISRSIYLAGMRLMQPAGVAEELTPTEASIQAARVQLARDLGTALELDAKQEAHLVNNLLGLAAAAMQLVLLCWSLDSSAPGLEVVCSPHAGEEWDATTMEPAVKEVPVQGLTRRVVLACVRPSLQYQPSLQLMSTSSSGTSGLTPAVLVKAQVVTFVPAPAATHSPAVPIPKPPTTGAHEPAPDPPSPSESDVAGSDKLAYEPPPNVDHDPLEAHQPAADGAGRHPLSPWGKAPPSTTSGSNAGPTTASNTTTTEAAEERADTVSIDGSIKELPGHHAGEHKPKPRVP